MLYFCTAKTSKFRQNASNLFANSKMKFQKNHVQQMLPCLSSILMNCFFRNFANVFRKWKTTWRFAEFIVKFCENFLKFFLEISETENFIIQFSFSCFFNSLRRRKTRRRRWRGARRRRARRGRAGGRLRAGTNTWFVTRKKVRCSKQLSFLMNCSAFF